MNSDDTIWIAVFLIALMVVGGAAWYLSNAPVIPKYDLSLSIQPSSTDIGNLTITNGDSYHYNITGSYFNVSLKGFVNYTVTFGYDVAYGNFYNTTAHIYLQGNLSVSFKTTIGSATPGPIYIS